MPDARPLLHHLKREIHEDLRRRVLDLRIFTAIEYHKPRFVSERNTVQIPRTFDAVALDGVWDILDTLLADD